MKTRPKKIAAGVHFEKGVIEYLDKLAEDGLATRSTIINQIVKEHASIKGITVPTYTEKRKKPSSYHETVPPNTLESEAIEG